jgi:hypothetical protein
MAAMTPAPVAPPPAVTLAPHYGVALALTGLGVACLGLTPFWGRALLVAAPLSLFGLFLTLQTALLRLEFTPDALLVRRQETLLRRFPYEAWLAWRLFWPGLPALFFFRERASIHLLPVLFSPRELQEQLRLHLPHLADPLPATTHSPPAPAPAADDGQSPT